MNHILESFLNRGNAHKLNFVLVVYMSNGTSFHLAFTDIQYIFWKSILSTAGYKILLRQLDGLQRIVK